MCGIVGWLSFSGPASPELALRMAEVVRHRGPDDDGVFVDGAVALGFRRLSIIDVAGGHQPITTDCGRFTIVFNGEIYNYQEIRAQLQQQGVRFRTSSDTEAILLGYREWGPGVLDRLNGMFAIAIWDAEQRELFLARDRLGKKPLYYFQAPQAFCFASEIKALFAHPLVPIAVDARRIPTLLTYRYVPGAETLFAGVGCLPPACWMRVSALGEVGGPQRYWDYAFAEAVDASQSREQAERAQDELEALLESAVRLRLISEVPLGAFLSGGIDSSMIVALMSKAQTEPVKTFSIGFDTGFTEGRFARDVAQLFRTDHHEIRIGSRELIEALPRVLHARETPVTEASDIPLYLLAKLARTRVTVALSGEGSDELLGGYPKYAFERIWNGSAPALGRRLAGALSPLLPYGLRRAQLALECASEADALERYACWFGALQPGSRRELIVPELLQDAEVHTYSAEALDGKHFPSAVEAMLYLDTRHWLPANLLLRGDRMTMAHSLELRCPYLDYRLVEFAARLPLRLKVRGLKGKWILSRLGGKYLPRAIVRRPKWGFKVPVGEWFRGPLAGVLQDVLLSPTALARGYFREEALRSMVTAHLSGRRNHEKALWILFQLELWHRMFIDRTLSPSDRLI